MTREPSPRRVALIPFFCLLLLCLLKPLVARAGTVNIVFPAKDTCGEEFTATPPGEWGSGNPDYYSPGDVVFTFSSSNCVIDDILVDSRSVGSASRQTVTVGEASLIITVKMSRAAYTITTTHNDYGTVTPSCDGPVPPGGSCVLRLEPNPGYTVGPPTISPAGRAQGVLTRSGTYFLYTLSNVSGDVNVVIPFVTAYYITVSASDATIKDGDGATVSPGSAVVVAEGDTPTFTVTPSAGFTCVQVTTPTGEIPCDPSHKYTLKPVTQNGELKVVTARGYTIIASAGANGTISPKDAVPVAAGSSRTFTFTPASGFTVDTVTVDSISQSTGTTYTFPNVQGNHSIDVTFRPAGARMKNYCNAPPFVASGVKSNLLLLIDNSASMYDLAYTGANYCVDDSYSNTSSYAGYFDEGGVYAYDDASQSFVAGATLPSSCNGISTTYLCLQMNGSRSPRTVARFVASGKFLNWLTSSKLDVEKRVLTGGKFVAQGSATSGKLVGESRGCQGKRYVKLLPRRSDRSYPPITFAVRGPLNGEADFPYDASRGGATRIEVYDKAYQSDACQEVIDSWLTVKGGSDNGKEGDNDVLREVKEQIFNCLDHPVQSSGQPTKSRVYSLVMNDCFYYLKTDVVPEDTELARGCAARFSTTGGAGTATELNDTVCANNVSHALHTILGGTASATGSTTGFLGNCSASGNTRPECAGDQVKDYCLEIKQPTITDPAATSSASEGETASIRSFVLEAGTAGLGSAAGTFFAQISLPFPPRGQIQAFSSEMNIGAMVFHNGAGSECGKGSEIIPCIAHCSIKHKECYQNTDCEDGESCIPEVPTDGGKVIAHLNYTPVGDHSGAGLIAAIDNIGSSSGASANVWTPFAEAFYNAIGYFAGRTDLRLQAGDFDEKMPPTQYSCQMNNVLILSDGMSTADNNSRVSQLVETYRTSSVQAIAKLYNPAEEGGTGRDSVNNCPAFQGSRNLDDLVWIASHRDIKDLTTSSASDQAPRNASRQITTHAIYLGPTADPKTAPPGECDPSTLLRHAADVSGGRFTPVPDASRLDEAFRGMLQLISGGSNAGSDATLLSTGDGNGALFLQPLFYTRKSFDKGKSSVSWIGELQSLWYYLDPMLGNSDGSANTIREDTGYSGSGEHLLDLKTDRVVEFSFNSDQNRSEAKLFSDNNGDGKIDVPQPSGFPLVKDPDEVQSIWRAGLELWKKTPAARKVYTQTDDRTLVDFSTLDTDSSTNRTLLQAAGKDEAGAIIDFVLGNEAPSGVRDRSVAMSAAESTEKVWKLGDIISSTPRVQAQSSLNSYQLPPPRGYRDLSYDSFINSPSYQNRGTVYVGANDGMLHAFRLGKLRLGPVPQDVSSAHPHDAEDPWPVTQKGALSGAGLGEEAWGFVPKNALPYLKYLKDPLYTHLYYVDGGITLSDVSIGKPELCTSSDYSHCLKDAKNGSNWRTVLIGGMGLGGGTRGPGDSCSDTATGSCVKTPAEGVGFSSYFALDVTGQSSEGTTEPKLLWEFAPPGLGYATSGAAIVKVSARDTRNFASRERNGKWFAVFGSGPTGPIDCDSCQFRGTSDQRLKIFVVDIGAHGPLVEGTSYWVIDTKIENAFAGSISGGAIDVDKADVGQGGYYQDDAVYIGYTRKGEGGEWNKGGVLRLVTKEDPSDPSRWVASTVIDGIGPVTGGVTKLQDRTRKNLWLYFGTGRYSYNQDDISGARALYGIKEPCYSRDIILPNRLDQACTLSRSVSELTDKTRESSDKLNLTQDKGWYVELEEANKPESGFGSERVLAMPSSSTAGAVFFTSFKPSTDRCFMGGKSYLWGLKYDTGAALAGTAAAFNGKALTYLSTGTLAAFGVKSFPDALGRRSSAMIGKPGGVKIVSNSGLKPVRKILHMQER
ncbi:pilus assembly protein PilY [Geomonas sp. RF6]|uniref:pilus assembly protein PilY n=1 Tax=Geomonas sp. RF6 TaxID=2897342 RepID=UPI001E54F085|nr:pilus assembly protein PilY [Geomonas sp. RF6]UFS69586.1 pilus assembly protein PilY [Geomonas sp. RF6]